MSRLVVDGWAGSQPGAGRGAGSQGKLCPRFGAAHPCAAAGAETQKAGPYFLPPAPFQDSAAVGASTAESPWVLSLPGSWDTAICCKWTSSITLIL